MMGNTPSPWGVKAIAAALHAAHHHDGPWIGELGEDENMPDYDDATLIAAAPKMKEALESILSLCIPGMNWTCPVGKEALKKARAALAACEKEGEE